MSDETGRTITIPLDFSVGVTDPALDPDSNHDLYRTLRGRAALAALNNGGGPHDVLSIGQAVALLVEQTASMPGGITGWVTENWAALVTDEDPALPVGHLMELTRDEQSRPQSAGWLCSCGAEETPRYASNALAERFHAEHVKREELRDTDPLAVET